MYGRTSTTSERLKEVLRSFDVHPKSQEDVQVRTKGGALVTVFAAFMLILLLGFEIAAFRHPPTEDIITVDTVPDYLWITFDIEFPNLPCSRAQIDLVDDTGEEIIEKFILSTRILRQPLPPNRDFGSDPPGYCGTCLSPEEDRELHLGCCNTCDAVRAAYNKANRQTIEADRSPQCLKARRARFSHFGGCRIQGFFEAQKVKGNLHVAAGNASEESHGGHKHHLHVLHPDDVDQFDISYKIHQLSFGKPFPGQRSPLEGTVFLAPGVVQVLYLVQLVPTTYIYTTGRATLSSQYSVTEHVRHVNFQSKEGWFLPGVFFKYDVSGLRIRYTEQERSWGHFFTQLCAILGGTYVVLGMAYNVLDSVLAAFWKRQKSSAVISEY